jgi:glycosyltransferase involved in cell wall biosynthesis
MKESGRLKVLVTAHEFSPNMGSECSSGWNILTKLGQFHDITLIYAETNQFGTVNYKDLISSYYDSEKFQPDINLVPVGQPLATRFIAAFNKFLSAKKTSVGLPFLYFLGVRFWEKRVFRMATKLNHEVVFDIVHHFNHISFREPGFLYKLNIPVVWGPTSGFSAVHFSFLKALPFQEMALTAFRNIANVLQFNLSHRVRKAIRSAAIIYYVTKEDYSSFSKLSNRTKQLLDMGTYSSSSAVVRDVQVNKPLRALWAGRLSSLKALHLIIRAIGERSILGNALELSVVGDGPQKKYFQEIAEKYKIRNIKWLGHIAKDQVYNLMINSDVLIHTSIKEAASAVVLESLSAGLPVICHDAFGMSYSVTDDCGIKIPLDSPVSSIKGFRKALESLVNNPSSVSRLQSGALERSKSLTWDFIAQTIANDYINIMEHHGHHHK